MKKKNATKPQEVNCRTAERCNKHRNQLIQGAYSGSRIRGAFACRSQMYNSRVNETAAFNGFPLFWPAFERKPCSVIFSSGLASPSRSKIPRCPPRAQFRRSATLSTPQLEATVCRNDVPLNLARFAMPRDHRDWFNSRILLSERAPVNFTVKRIVNGGTSKGFPPGSRILLSICICIFAVCVFREHAGGAYLRDTLFNWG